MQYEVEIKALIADKQVSFMDATQKMQLAEKAANIQLKLAQGALTRNQAAHEIKKIAEVLNCTFEPNLILNDTGDKF